MDGNPWCSPCSSGGSIRKAKGETPIDALESMAYPYKYTTKAQTL